MQAIQASTTPRRALFGAPAALALAGLGIASRPAVAAAGAPDPVVTLHRQWEPLNAEADRLAFTPGADRYEADRVDELAYDVRLAILTAPATTAAGMAIKLQHALDGFPCDLGEAWEKDAQAALREAMRFLTRETVA